MTSSHTQSIHLQPENNHLLQNLCGCHNEHITTLEHHFTVQINHRGFHFKIIGEKSKVEHATQALSILYQASTTTLSREQIHHTLINGATAKTTHRTLEINQKTIKINTPNQIAYIDKLQSEHNTITFAIGPAGTGKTFLAVLIALKMLKKEKCKRIILTRPVIEAGEQLGFLPGDVLEKTYPYLQPLYDSMYQILSKEEVDKMMEKNIIEIAPLAFMRGRTFNESFIILDEAQNTTTKQMQMFLTRIGYDSKVVVTGDNSQTDIPNKQSGLLSAPHILKNIQGIDFVTLQPQDIKRHRIVQLITQAYEQNNQ